jgi:membrane associated rhomboid family serine protease
MMPNLSRTHKFFLGTCLIVFIGHTALELTGVIGGLKFFLGLKPSFDVTLIWSWITYPFVETQLLSLVFNGLAFWWIGSELESRWGQGIYLKFLFALHILTTLLAWGVLGLMANSGLSLGPLTLAGLAGIVMGLMVAYAQLYPDRQFLMLLMFPLKAKVFLAILVGMEIYFALVSRQFASLVHLIAMGISWLLMRYQTHLDWYFRPRANPLTQLRMQQKLRSSHLKIVKTDEDEPPRYH